MPDEKSFQAGNETAGYWAEGYYNHGITNALATGWISVGNLWMMGGLLIAIKKGGWKNKA